MRFLFGGAEDEETEETSQTQVYLLEAAWGGSLGDLALEHFLGSKVEKATWRIVPMGVKERGVDIWEESGGGDEDK